MRTAELAFDLDSTLLARQPRETQGQSRKDARMLVIQKNGPFSHDQFTNLPSYLQPGDVLVLNNSRVIPAVIRVATSRGKKLELRLASNKHGGVWHVALTPDTDLKLGDTLYTANQSLQCTIVGRRTDVFKGWIVQFLLNGEPTSDADLFQTLDRIGRPVISMYTTRVWDLDYYQNVFSTVPGSCEAPTAGRHFTQDVLDGLTAQGVNIAYITLNIGLSSVLIREDNIEDHAMPEEEYAVSQETAAVINAAHESGHHVLATGTTVVRTLETVTDSNGEVHPGTGWTDLYVRPGYEFRCCDAILTNFHGPMTSRLALSAAYAGWPNVKRAYEDAIRERYLFYEFGDVTLLI